MVSFGPANAWAVGKGRNGAALAEHWNGTAWSVVQVPTPAGAAGSQLSGISALSPSDIWAADSVITVVGTTIQTRTLIEHWNGSSWSVVASPNVGGNDNLLNGVSATTGDVWTVGSSDVFAHTLALRETG